MTVKDDSNVTLTGLTVDGRDQGNIPSPPGAYNFVGVYVIDSDAHIDGIAVANVRELQGGVTSGNQRNHAIIVTGYDEAHGGAAGGYNVEIENSTITNFQKTGIFANGGGLTVDIHDNDIVGTQTAFQTQNGMQIGSSGAFAGTTGTIHDNTVTDIGFNDPTTSNSQHRRGDRHPHLAQRLRARDRRQRRVRLCAVQHQPVLRQQRHRVASIPTAATSTATPSRASTTRSATRTIAARRPRC